MSYTDVLKQLMKELGKWKLGKKNRLNCFHCIDNRRVNVFISSLGYFVVAVPYK